MTINQGVQRHLIGRVASRGSDQLSIRPMARAGQSWFFLFPHHIKMPRSVFKRQSCDTGRPIATGGPASGKTDTW